MTPRRKSKKNTYSIRPKQIVMMLAGLGVISLIANNISSLVLALFILVGSGLVLWLFIRSRRNATQVRILQRLPDAIQRHESALISYYHQSRREDLFGGVDETRWRERVDQFLRQQVVPEIGDFSVWRRSSTGQKASSMVHEATVQRVALQKETNPLIQVDASSLTPIEYERHCAALLEAQGWTTRMTPATRDGGADFIAEKHNWRMVVQCKRYAQPVGNKAVQEINSAVRLYNGNIACVVAPTGFTRQAQQEALGLSVNLLHHSELPTFAAKLLDDRTSA